MSASTIASSSADPPAPRPVRAIPGPRGRDAWAFLGIGTAESLLAFFARTARRYGPISSFRVFGQRVVLLDDADLIAEVLQNQQHRFARDTGAVLLREIVGDGVLTTDDPAHLVRRRLLQPAFHRVRIAAYADVMVEEAERAAERWRAVQQIDVRDEMTRLTLGVVGRCLFGTELADATKDIASVIASIAGRGGKLQPLVAALAPLLFALRRLTPPSTRLVFRRERARLETVVDPIVARRRAAGGDEHDLLAALLATRDEEGRGLDDTDVRNELITFVLAGHETTASALTWAWQAVAREPRIEARLVEEVRDVLGDRPATMDDLPRLRYAAQIFDEALRMFPPAAAFGRRPIEDVVLGGYRIPRGTAVFLSPYVTHRNPRYFPDPECFAPERWEREAPPKFAFFPFGGGSKMCIGEPFARAEGVLILATLARRWRLRLADATAVGPGPSALLRPARPIVATLEPQARPSLSS